MKQTTILLLSTFLWFSCKTVKPIAQSNTQQAEKQAIELQISQIKAVDLEESISGSDELMLNYSMASYDEKGKALEVVNGVWGVEKAKKGQVFSENFKPIQLNLPKNGKIVVSVILTEIEDYEKAKKVITSINQLGGVAQGAVALLEIASYETPLAFVTGTLQAAGLSIKLIDHFDKDDILGSDIRTFQTFTQPITVPLVFKGKVLLDNYEYNLTYRVGLK